MGATGPCSPQMLKRGQHAFWPQLNASQVLLSKAGPLAPPCPFWTQWNGLQKDIFQLQKALLFFERILSLPKGHFRPPMGPFRIKNCLLQMDPFQLQNGSFNSKRFFCLKRPLFSPKWILDSKWTISPLKKTFYALKKSFFTWVRSLFGSKRPFSAEKGPFILHAILALKWSFWTLGMAPSMIKY